MRINLPVTQKENDGMWNDEIICSKTDTSGIITYANEALCRISGFSETEMLGRPHNVMRHPDMPRVAYAWCWDVLGSGRNWRGIVKNRCRNGDHYWVDANVSPQFGPDGDIRGYFSARRKPTHAQVAEADALYAELRQQEGSLEQRGKLSRSAIIQLYREGPLYRAPAMQEA